MNVGFPEKGILTLFNPSYSFNRVSPLVVLFFIGIVLIFLGLFLTPLLVKIGWFVIFAFFVALIFWLIFRFKNL